MNIPSLMVWGRHLLLTGLFLLLFSASQAQPGNGGPAPVPTNVPLDGGASLLLAGGVAYAVRQLRARRAVRHNRA